MKASVVVVGVEKPFGTDLASARSLNARLLKFANEHQIYRIDHYLGKETVQNILVLRFANGMFEPIWNANYIDHVQITVAETVGLESATLKQLGGHPNTPPLGDTYYTQTAFRFGDKLELLPIAPRRGLFSLPRLGFAMLAADMAANLEDRAHWSRLGL